jgi:hypothetical protein
MTRLKKVLRLFGFILLIAMATMGAGFGASIFPNYRERFQNKTIQIELVSKKDEKENEDDQEKKQIL